MAHVIRYYSIFCFGLFVLPFLAAASQKGVSISLRARWEGTSYLLEAAEFLAAERPSLYWKYIEQWTSSFEGDTNACWKHIITSAAKLLPGKVGEILPLALGARLYSPKLEAYRQILSQQNTTRQGGCCIAEVGSKTATTVHEVQALISDALATGDLVRSEQYDFDHVYGEDESSEGAVVVVLYAPPGAPCFQELHQHLKAAVAKSSGELVRVVYIHRPIIPKDCKVDSCIALGTESQLMLPGYGVEAALKNMEYSAMDDKKKQDDSQGSSGGDSEGVALGEVKGFNFDVLVERKPALRQELLTFRDHLLSSDEEEVVKVWDIKDCGLQAAQRIMSAADPLLLLNDIAQSFPALVSSLSRQKVDEALRNSVQYNQQMVSPGANFMLINGLAVDVNNFDFYALMERLRIELRLTDALGQQGLGTNEVLTLLQLRAEDGSENMDEVRLDVGPLTNFVFINDLERDAMYARFPSNLMEILNTFPGRLKGLARNAYTGVFVMDPVSQEAAAILPVLDRMYQGFYPIRIGFGLRVPAVVERALAQRRQGSTVAQPEWEQMSASEKFARAFYTISYAFSGNLAYKFWVKYLTEMESGMPSDVALSFSFVEVWDKAGRGSGLSQRARLAARKTGDEAWQQVTRGEGYSSEVGMLLFDATNHLISKGLTAFTVPVMVLNGVVVPLSESALGLDQDVLYRLLMEQQTLQELVYYQKVTSSDAAILDKVLEVKGSVGRWSPKIMGREEQQDGDKAAGAVLDMSRVLTHPGARHALLLYREAGRMAVPPATHWLVTDLGAADGRALLLAALQFMVDTAGSRGSRVYVTLNPAGAEGPLLLDLVLEWCGTAMPRTSVPRLRIAQFLKKVLGDSALVAQLTVPLSKAKPQLAESVDKLAQDTGAAATQSFVDFTLDFIDKVVPDKSKAAMDLGHEAAAFYTSGINLASSVFELRPGVCAVFTNGRALLVSDLERAVSEELMAEDFTLLQLNAAQYRMGDGLAKSVQKLYEAGDIKAPVFAPPPVGTTPSPELMRAATYASLGDIVMVAASLLSAQKYPESRLPASTSKQVQQIVGILRGQALEVAARDPANTPFHVVAVINPLSRTSQRIAQVLNWLRDTLGPSMSLYLNPQRDYSDMPLKSFYRYALPEFTRDEDGLLSMPGSPSAYFPRLPRKRVMTINMEVPEAWLVEPVQAVYDMDNLRLADVSGQVAYAEFELEALMLTGSCMDVSEGQGRATHTRGLQLYLGTPARPHIVDTLVMANLAYFQLKAYPGMWLLSLAPGRTQELYTINQGQAAVDASPALGHMDPTLSTKVVISSFTGRHVVLRVGKRPGMEEEDVLKEAGDTASEEDEEGGMWGNIKSLFSGDEGSKRVAFTPPDPNEPINVFTVASGHMYERLQKIMMLSVIKNTKSKVKFWIIKNYISPDHKRVIPAMAAHYGFEYEFVTYKWPHWLHKQTEKQRIMWAYKILFLDVLLPLDVQRIIFVDSDQVIRTDLRQLYDMDIKGAALAYTPFCDNNKEMDEYRFWKGGFWRDHLRGLPYHISALYLVDLKRFRQIAAGDNYRVIYEQLSKDPNSLANLDQDLPNYAQHQIRIHSLSPEWLWCESWCGNETKHLAKTIDLCNNPRTKEPKLQAARRILAEWPGLDEEVASFTASVHAQIEAEQQQQGFSDIMHSHEEEGPGPETRTTAPPATPSKQDSEVDDEASPATDAAPVKHDPTEL